MNLNDMYLFAQQSPYAAATELFNALKQCDELAAVLRTIVALDDGDAVALWRFKVEFEAARKVLAKRERAPKHISAHY